MKNIIIHKIKSGFLVLSISGPSVEVISLLINLILAFYGLIRAVQMLRKFVKTFDFGKIKGNLFKVFSKFWVPGRLSSIPNFDTLGIRKFVREIQELYGRILSSFPKGTPLLKHISKLQKKIYDYLN